MSPSLYREITRSVGAHLSNNSCVFKNTYNGHYDWCWKQSREVQPF